MNKNEQIEWVEKANSEKYLEVSEPFWSFDCGQKLDFDGGFIRISSRFYPQGCDIYSGELSFLVDDKEIFQREFSPRHIDILRDDVEGYVDNVKKNIAGLINNNKGVFV